jgi:23S rRNA (cytidine2498-2'-O)-methyltransferase
MRYILAYCREGFERDLLEELMMHMQRVGAHPVAVHKKLKGLVIVKDEMGDPDKLREAITPAALVFARQIIHAAPLLVTFDGVDRAGPLVDALVQHADINLPRRLYSDIFIETPDTNEGKQLSPFCRKFENPFVSRLKRAGFKKIYSSRNEPRIHALFLDYDSGLIGVSHPVSASPHPMGIIRLKFPREAPSRSTLKLEEAFHVLLSDEERVALLQPGMNAVDLGAAPGGWTYQLVRRGVHVTAVDNGALEDSLAASPLVTHLRHDAYKFRPSSPVDWMVCDMVDRPQEVARLAGRWFAERLCTMAVVNLKLPMKNHHETVMACLAMMREAACGGLDHYQIQARQLYHDRDEVTVMIKK